MVSWRKICVVIVTLVIVLPAILLVSVNNKPVNSNALHYTYSIVNVYPHDANAFTEGLVFDGGFLYESTGLYSNSSLRRVDLETGGVLQLLSLQPQYFGEGIAVVGDKIVQLTWRSHVGFVYDRASFGLLQEFEYPTEGWGLTYDGSQLIMSDGMANLYFLDPVTFQRVGQVAVHDTGPVTRLNELEYINGAVYANVWREERIAVINPLNGQATAWIDLTGIQDFKNQDPNNVPNGIAYDANGDGLFVTGKMWPHVFEIKLIPSA
jgi:glutamine cyclotransferase